MKTKKLDLLFLPFWILLASFCIYLLSMTIFLKIDHNINDNFIFPTINQIFLLGPSYITQLLLVLLMLSLFINYLFTKKYLIKRNLEIIERKIHLKLLLSLVISLLVVFIINIMILFINQNFEQIIYESRKVKKIAIRLAYTKIFEYFYIYTFRLIYWFLLTFLFIKISNNFKRGIIFIFVFVTIWLISLILGILYYQISHDRLTNYIIIILSSLVFPEIINSVYLFRNIAMTLGKFANNIYLINLVYILAFILFTALIIKLKNKNKLVFSKL